MGNRHHMPRRGSFAHSVAQQTTQTTPPDDPASTLVGRLDLDKYKATIKVRPSSPCSGSRCQRPIHLHSTCAAAAVIAGAHPDDCDLRAGGVGVNGVPVTRGTDEVATLAQRA